MPTTREEAKKRAKANRSLGPSRPQGRHERNALNFDPANCSQMYNGNATLGQKYIKPLDKIQPSYFPPSALLNEPYPLLQPYYCQSSLICLCHPFQHWPSLRTGWVALRINDVGKEANPTKIVSVDRKFDLFDGLQHGKNNGSIYVNIVNMFLTQYISYLC